MATNIRSSFGNMVRQKRMLLGISQEELAFSSGLHRTYISDIERGTRNVALENIEKIANALGIQPKDLLDFTTSSNFQQKENSGGESNEN